MAGPLGGVLRFLAGINAEGVDAVAFRLELIDKRLGLSCIAPADANSVTAAGKPPRNSSADGITRADQHRDSATFSHARPSSKFLFDTHRYRLKAAL
jgi:hypothetical protein